MSGLATGMEETRRQGGNSERQRKACYEVSKWTSSRQDIIGRIRQDTINNDNHFSDNGQWPSMFLAIRSRNNALVLVAVERLLECKGRRNAFANESRTRTASENRDAESVCVCTKTSLRYITMRGFRHNLSDEIVFDNANNVKRGSNGARTASEHTYALVTGANR